MKDEITISKKEYKELIAKSNRFDLQYKFFTDIRNELLPTDKDLHLPWYEMLAKCIKNRQFIK